MKAAIAPLRELESWRVTKDGAELVLVRDPLGVSARAREPFALRVRDFEIARQFDGRRGAWEIARDLAPADFGGRPTEDEVVAVAAALAREVLLDDEVFEEERQRQLGAFRALPHRPAVGSGRDYSADNFDLRMQLGGIVANDWDMPHPEGLVGLIAPATDFTRARKLYGRVWAAARHGLRDVQRLVLLGAGRRPTVRLLAPCPRPFRTPLGVAELDTEALARLAVVPGPDELAHRDALVLERHLLFAQLLASRVPVLPLLIGTLPDDLEDPRTDEDAVSAIDALCRVLELPGRTLLVVASDLARIGAGHASPLSPSPSIARTLRDRDARLGECASSLDAERLWSTEGRRGDRGRAASLTPIWLALSALRADGERRGVPGRGSVLGYEQLQSASDLVTCAAIALLEEQR